MTLTRRILLRSSLATLSLATLPLSACGSRRERRQERQEHKASKPSKSFSSFDPPLYPNETAQLRRQINKWADLYEIPRELVHKVCIRESTHRPWATNPPYMGLMQIHPNTARGMGYTGSAEGLLDAETNLKYAGKYLRGAWMVSDGNMDTAIGWYARGYYYEAKKRGLLKETGLI